MHTLCITAADVTRPDMGNIMMNEAIPRVGLSARYVGSACVCAKNGSLLPIIAPFCAVIAFPVFTFLPCKSSQACEKLCERCWDAPVFHL